MGTTRIPVDTESQHEVSGEQNSSEDTPSIEEDEVKVFGFLRMEQSDDPRVSDKLPAQKNAKALMESLAGQEPEQS